jgi:hypothetical protein
MLFEMALALTPILLGLKLGPAVGLAWPPSTGEPMARIDPGGSRRPSPWPRRSGQRRWPWSSCGGPAGSV